MGGYNPEQWMLSQSEVRLSEAQEALFPLLVPENEAKAIDMEKFRDIHDVDSDLAYVREREEGFKRKDEREGTSEGSRKAGKLFESIINFGIDNAGFLGEDATAIVPSRYDDIHNGIDSIVEFESEEGMMSHLALGIDVTRNPDDIRKKFSDIRKSINEGELSTVKYFQTKNFHGKLSNIARVIVGADQPTIDNISDLIVRSMRMRKTIKASKASGAISESEKNLPQKLGEVMTSLGNHPLQWIVLLEIQQQLSAYRTYAQKLNRPKAVDAYNTVISIIERVIEDKKESIQEKDGNMPVIDDATLATDRVYQLIQQEVRSF